MKWSLGVSLYGRLVLNSTFKSSVEFSYVVLYRNKILIVPFSVIYVRGTVGLRLGAASSVDVGVL